MGLQRQPAGRHEPDMVPPIVYEVLRSSGQRLDAETRAFFGPRFGHDFSQVRIHTDAKAAESAKAVNALAYTVNREVVFGAGEYAPGTVAGQRLLSHELTHVAQHEGVGSDTYLSTTSLMLGPTNDPLEREAMIHAERLTAAGTEPPARLTTNQALLRRPIDSGAKRSSPIEQSVKEPVFPVSGVSTCFCDDGDTYTYGKGVACDTGKCPDETGIFAAWPNTSDACKKITSEGKNVPRATCKQTLTVSYGGKSVDVKVRDCGPGGKDRIIDLSLAAAKALDPKVKTCGDWGNDKTVIVRK